MTRCQSTTTPTLPVTRMGTVLVRITPILRRISLPVTRMRMAPVQTTPAERHLIKNEQGLKALARLGSIEDVQFEPRASLEAGLGGRQPYRFNADHGKHAHVRLVRFRTAHNCL